MQIRYTADQTRPLDIIESYSCLLLNIQILLTEIFFKMYLACLLHLTMTNVYNNVWKTAIREFFQIKLFLEKK